MSRQRPFHYATPFLFAYLKNIPRVYDAIPVDVADPPLELTNDSVGLQTSSIRRCLRLLACVLVVFGEFSKTTYNRQYDSDVCS